MIAARGEEGAAQVRELTGGYGALGVCEAVGTQGAMDERREIKVLLEV